MSDVSFEWVCVMMVELWMSFDVSYEVNDGNEETNEVIEWGK